MREQPTELLSLFLTSGGSRLVDDISSPCVSLISTDMLTVNNMLTANGQTVADFSDHGQLVNHRSAISANDFAVFFDPLFLVAFRIGTFLRLGFLSLWRWSRLRVFDTVQPLDGPLGPPWGFLDRDCYRHDLVSLVFTWDDKLIVCMRNEGSRYICMPIGP